MVEEKTKTINLTIPVIFVLAVTASFLVGFSWKEFRRGKTGPTAEIRVEKSAEQARQTVGQAEEVLGEQLVKTIGNFSVTKDEACREDGKPVVYMFGGNFCGHCQWEHPIFEKTAAKFKGLVVVHDNMDDRESDRDIWEKYSEINRGGVPFLVLGCRYARVGSGQNAGEEGEEDNLTALICKLTDNQPASVCAEVKDLVGQIEG